MDRTQLIEQALGLAQAVVAFAARARQFFYEVVLSDQACPQCNGGRAMEAEGRCSCRKCGRALDPTVAFQRCSVCDGKPRLLVRRYECSQCGAGIVSRFLFDGLAFDPEYFQQKMAESRQRKQERRERVRLMLAESRSGAVEVAPADLEAVPGLLEALNGFVSNPEAVIASAPHGGFDLHRYQSHIQAHVRQIPLSLEEIPPLGEDARIDRIWRFIAIIFLAHAGILDVWQQGQTIMVIQREADREGQDLPGDLEEADGVQGSPGRAEA